MGKPIDDPKFWKDRIARAPVEHHSVYITGTSDWERINAAHEKIFDKEVKPTDRVLDAGCGYGRWAKRFHPSRYVGIDFSPDFVALAKEKNPEYDFAQADLKQLPWRSAAFDVAFCVSIKRMVQANLGEEVWAQMERELRRVAKRVLILEYEDPEPYEVLEGTCA